MHLKKLSLSGFKSFADETHLEFGPGLTAVVGPNGSGKSNIVDALLWALGERSHKALRGHAATDVIFNGSGARKPTNLAEVSLFFDNLDRALPLNFEEVQVTRRLFRDGEGEYALGGSKCRLRDVTDLFLDTGVGPDAYCIISQGEIDAILSARAEDRRGLIEGAAGIQKYHARRTETRRKLERVEADLTRVFDIISELDSQLAPLEAQATLAREYDAFVARLKFLQLAVLARDYDVRLKRLASLEEAQRQNGELVGKNRAEIENLERLESLTERRLRELEAQVERLSGELTEAVSRLKATEGQIAVARERRKALTEQQEFQAREIGLLRARISQNAESLAAGREELAGAQKSAGELSGAAAEAEAKLGAANARLSEATNQWQSLQAQVIELMRAGQNRREKAAGSRAEIVGLENRLADLEKLLAQGQTEAATLAGEGENARGALEKLKTGLEEAQTASLERRAAWEDAQNAQKAAADAQNGLRENRARLQSRVGALRELEQSLEGVQGGARAVLQAVKRGQLPDVFSTVADAIRAPKELEMALEVALGGAVHNLICAGDADAKRAIGWLKQNQAGRATFLPLETLRPARSGERTHSVLHDPAARGIAAELVECAPENRAAIDYLLGRILIVETLDDATRLAKRCDFGTRLVTLEGELVLPGGAITGGQGRQKSSGLLARKRELDEAAERLASIETEISDAAQRAQEAALAVEKEQENWRKTGEAANDLKNQIARQEREAEHLEREARRLKTQREAVESQIAATKASLELKNSQQDDWEKIEAVGDEKARELEARVAEAQQVAAQRQDERERVAAEVSDVRAGYGATQERLAALKRALAELERAGRDFDAQIGAKQLQIDRAAGENTQIVGSESNLVSLLAEFQKRREDLESSLAAARLERGAALEKLGATGATLKTTRGLLHEAEDELHRVEVRLASTQTEMADMERRFSEEFGLEKDAALNHREDIEQKQAALDEIEDLTAKIGGLGGVNLGAIGQFEQVRERLEFLTTQRDDLLGSKAELDAIIAEIDGRMREQFLTTFRAIQVAFAEMFDKTFGGGATHLTLTDPDNLLETGIDLRVQMPGKAAQDISLLSGGERALTALSFMMALLKVRPSPFVVLDEVDAPLDQSNVHRFTDLLREFTATTQFIVITHNNGTMQAADVLYGVTQQEAGISTLMSVKLVEEEAS